MRCKGSRQQTLSQRQCTQKKQTNNTNMECRFRVGIQPNADTTDETYFLLYVCNIHVTDIHTKHTKHTQINIMIYDMRRLHIWKLCWSRMVDNIPVVWNVNLTCIGIDNKKTMHEHTFYADTQLIIMYEREGNMEVHFVDFIWRFFCCPFFSAICQPWIHILIHSVFVLRLCGFCRLWMIWNNRVSEHIIRLHTMCLQK